MIFKIINRLSLYKRKLFTFYFLYIRTRLMPVRLTFQTLPLLTQKTRIAGFGRIELGKSVMLGIRTSPFLNTGEFYMAANKHCSAIKIGSDVSINNNAAIIANTSTITIGDNTLIGPNFMCFDSNFHSLDPTKRLIPAEAKSKAVLIGNNVFIGANVTVLKGSIIGDNSVIGAGCVISGEIPRDSVVSCATNNTITMLKY
ncbi:transferase [Shewanella sp. Choline-02u-19]|nr:transferase [Shewanella sp. Bg11-22]PKI26908.1 transferase [Shewanella sp. Choline-02u-19]